MIATIMAAAALCMGAAADTTVTLQTVTVTGLSHSAHQLRTSQSTVTVGHDYLEQHFAGSLLQTLEGIPGLKAMSIGSGQSKPVIRGLGFNRLVVSEDGIKHEGQQWGDDHGLEIDQFAVDRAEVIKGPAALLYGGDAIGGVLALYTNHVPTRPLEGCVQLFGRTNNAQTGLSARIGGRVGDRLFFRANATLIDYGDYRVPTDSIQYYSYSLRLHRQHLRNTAGRERDGSVMLGYAGYRFHTDVRLSDSYAKSGFFANAHGLEVRLSGIDYDRSARDIDLPYQWVNHLKVMSHTTWQGDRVSAEVNLSYQHNRREEHAEPVSHGYMPRPDGTLERRFDKSTYTALGRVTCELADGHTLSAGLSGEHQHNRRGGWGFIIPDFETTTAGLYAADRLALSPGLMVNAGLRYDLAATHIHSYRDWYETPVTATAPAGPATGSVALQRSADRRRHFGSLTWAAGVSWATGPWLLKANVGKSFRVPIPKELGADGVNYHIFRYERGQAGLDAEQSYQADLGLHYASPSLTVQIDPYVNYFPNYIYLSPTAEYVEGLQLYEYTQARVLRYGVEAQADARLSRHWSATVQGEYLHARQRSGAKRGYTLPFSTPPSADVTVRYAFHWHGAWTAEAGAHAVADQREIVPPERPTAGYCTLRTAISHRLPLRRATLRTTLRVDNLLDRRYYDHTSYYRLIDVPEPGRNLSLMVAMEF